MIVYSNDTGNNTVNQNFVFQNFGKNMPLAFGKISLKPEHMMYEFVVAN